MDMCYQTRTWTNMFMFVPVQYIMVKFYRCLCQAMIIELQVLI